MGRIKELCGDHARQCPKCKVWMKAGVYVCKCKEKPK